jgi:Na+/H+ antiporter NhaD/arsenite permease-like protein
VEIFNIPVEFILFGLTLVGIAVFHKQTMWVSLTGMVLILLFKLWISPSGFNLAEHFIGSREVKGEWPILVNLAGLLFGFALLTKIFEDSGLPSVVPEILPGGWKKGFILLGFVFIFSTFLDNIAAAMLGGTMAWVVYKGRVHIAYLASIIAASNAGGAGSVVGDTTTTLMWIEGVHPLELLPGYIASISAFAVFGYAGARMQADYFRKNEPPDESILDPAVPPGQGRRVSFRKLLVVILIILGAIIANYLLNFPALGIWVVILISAVFIPMPWEMLGKSMKGTIFLLALVTSASLMPVNDLPPASALSTMLLGILSSVFDNIPLTKLCLEEGGYHWDLLAYSVGFGGSMIWFGSSTGVALSNLYPEIRSTGLYLKNSWHVVLAFFTGFVLLWLTRL